MVYPIIYDLFDDKLNDCLLMILRSVDLGKDLVSGFCADPCGRFRNVQRVTNLSKTCHLAFLITFNVLKCYPVRQMLQLALSSPINNASEKNLYPVRTETLFERPRNQSLNEAPVKANPDDLDHKVLKRPQQNWTKYVKQEVVAGCMLTLARSGALRPHAPHGLWFSVEISFALRLSSCPA